MNETIGKRIARHRKAKNLTQEALAELVGVSSQAVSKWENDLSCPDIALLPTLCGILGITSDELLTGKSNAVRLLPAGRRKSMEELTFRVKVNTTAGDRVRVNLPMTLVKIGLELGIDVTPHYTAGMESLKHVDVAKIVEMVEKGLVGKLVEVETAEGDIVEVVVE